MHTTQKSIPTQLKNGLLIGMLTFNIFIACTNKIQQLSMGASISSTRKEKDFIQTVQSGQLKDIQALLTNDSLNINYEDSNGNTALLHAVYMKDIDIVTLLLDEGANVNKRNRNGSTALLEAAYRSNVDIVKLLLNRGANIDQRTSGGETALHLAVWSDHIDIVKLLLNRGASVDLHTNARNSTSLIIAIHRRNVGIVKLLLDGGASINGEAKHHIHPLILVPSTDTALSHAICIRNRNIEIVKLILDKGTSIDDRNDALMTVILERNVNTNLLDTINLLVDYGANIRREDKYWIKKSLPADGRDDITTLLKKRGVYA